MKVTAKWIAEQCGVSRGTVDRVIYGRANVAPDVRERVQRCIKACGYQTPVQKRQEKTGEVKHNIGFILPTWDPYFLRRIHRGIEIATAHRGIQNMRVITEELGSRSDGAYLNAIKRLEEQKIEGLVMTAPNSRVIAEEIERLKRSGILTITCDSDVPDSARFFFIGQDMNRSGRIAAGLLAPHAKDAQVLVITGNRNFSGHELRVRGFLDRMYEISEDNIQVRVVECLERYDLTFEAVLDAVRRMPKLRAIYMANESVRACMDACSKLKILHQINIVCHDVTPYSKKHLIEGNINFIIDQDFSAQAIMALETMMRKINNNEMPRQAIAYNPTRVVTKELVE